jgi:hypothetical protein
VVSGILLYLDGCFVKKVECWSLVWAPPLFWWLFFARTEFGLFLFSDGRRFFFWWRLESILFCVAVFTLGLVL